MKMDKSLRKQLVKRLKGGDAHLEIQDVTDGLDPGLRSERHTKLPYSVWDLVEHIRIAQADIIDFSVDPNYESPSFPDEYWPEKRQQVPDEEWYGSIETIQSDRDRMIELIEEPEISLTEPFDHGSGQTLLRQAVLMVDHRSYHLGQIVCVRRLLGDWDSKSNLS